MQPFQRSKNPSQVNLFGELKYKYSFGTSIREPKLRSRQILITSTMFTPSYLEGHCLIRLFSGAGAVNSQLKLDKSGP